MQTLTITRPDDWHLHLRDDEGLACVLPHTVQRFARAIVMPNLKVPVTTTAAAHAYRERILEALAGASNADPGYERKDFQPLMTLYLTDNTDADEIVRARESGFVHAVKYYPAGATTNSDAGVTRLEHAFPALDAMQKHDLPLLLHGEVVARGVDVFDRERAFIDSVLVGIVRRFPELRIVFEHITTRDAVQYVKESGDKVAATITAHHLLYNRNAIFQGGIRPHYYCLPVLKREEHRQALLAAATGDGAKFFLGTDSAPHRRDAKEAACGCAGIYTAHAALEFYAEAFDAAGALSKLEGFASFHGPDFYRLSRNKGTVTLRKEAWRVPDCYPFAGDTVVPLRAGESIGWRLT